MNFTPKLPSLVLPQNRTTRTLLASFVSALMLFAGLGFAAPASASPIDSINLTSMTAPDSGWGGEAAASAINSAGQLVVLVHYHLQGFGMDDFYALETFDTDGTQNLSFGNSGWVRLPYTSSNILEILSGDRILVVGGYFDFSRSEPQVARIDVFDNAGAHDGTFGTDGIVYVASANSGGDIAPGIRQISVLPSGKIAVLMNYRDFNLSYEFVQVLQVRNSDGSLDESFSDNGETVLQAPEGSRSLEAYSFLVTAEGYVIAVDYMTEPDGENCYEDYFSGGSNCYPVDAPRVSSSITIGFDGLPATSPTPTTTPSSSDTPTAEPTSSPSETFTYTTDADSNVTVTGCVETCPADLVIPATLGGNPVTAIGDSAFSWKNLTSVIIPDSVTSIGDNAFYTNLLASVTIPDSVTSIGGAAFMYNQLTSSTMGNSVTSIGNAAFAYNLLTSVTIPVSVTSLGGGAFYSNKLTSVTIPDSLTHIADYVFAYNLLTSVTIPSSVTSVGSEAFDHNLLTSVTFLGNAPSDSGTAFDANSDLNFVDVAWNAVGWGETFSDIAVRVGEAPFTYTTDSNNNVTVTGCIETCPADLVIPATLGGNPVTAIGDFAFQNQGLTSVTIPDSVKVIGYAAFYINLLSSVTLPDSLTTIWGHAFRANSLSSVDIPQSVSLIGEWAFAYNQLTSVHFEGPAPTDQGGVFVSNPDLTFVDVAWNATGWNETFSDIAVRVGLAPFTYTTDADNNVTVTGCIETCPADLVIPSSLGGNPVTAIGDNAFKGAGLTSVVLPDSLVSIGYWAFENNSLTSVTLPESLTTLNAGAFYINSLVSVEVPSSVTTVGDYAFAKNALTSITFKGNAPAEAGSVFENNADLAAVDVAFGSTGWGSTFNGMTVRVGDAPFTYTVDENDNVTITGYGGDIPTDLVIPATLGGNPVTAIGNHAFYEKSLTSLSIPNSVTSIGDASFARTGLPSVSIPASVTSIGIGAFSGNTLTHISIPASVTVIGAYAFNGNDLTTVNFVGNAPTYGGSIFGNNDSLTAVDVSYGTTGWGSTFSGVTVRVNGAPAPKPASAPKIRSAKAGNGQVTLSIWAPRKNGGSEITGYEYTVDGGTTWAAVDASSTALSLVITGLDNATRYTVKVRALNGAGGGAASSAKSFTPRTVARAPVITSLTGLSAKIKVEIEAPAFDGGSKITRYAYSINEGAWHSWNAGGTGTPQFITGLKAGVSCSVRLRAYTVAGWGAISEAAIATPTRK